MVRMWQVDIPVFFTGKAEEETMRESLVQVFRTVIRSLFKTFDFLYFGWERTERVFHFFDTRR